MGFNNDGVIRINRRLEKRKSSNIVIGANIGKNKSTEINFAYKDYVLCIKELYSNVDYFTLNISSPNTFGLRTLLDIDPLRYLLDSVQNQNHQNSITRPMVIKISPDMSNEQILGLLEICKDYGISGVISNNTTINHNYDKGGLSGDPLSNRSEEILGILKESNRSNLTLISSGGVMDTKIANNRFEIGADLVQIYTGLIYEGPLFVRKIMEKYN
jgi:dihydroorotate dehydrogenase